ncbi:MAG: MFS transporter [Alphaproteobacteria bacterium]|nr:MFS transporter [Alphaproteobacteria bacterium]MDE2109611.1 MFS transporter [Alphaproteobacteria bacterium]MDE2493031.1 MFS transporter [Alphaproteobacteria bacterium]
MSGTGAGWRASFAAYLQPRVLVMLALGFSSGLPFLLVGNTFGYWLRDEGTSLAAIGFLSWVGIAYSLKFLWAPVIDRTNAPILAGLGRRRGWMLLAQLFVGGGLVAMAAAGVGHGLVTLGVLALVVAFSSATQDIVIDAWRIETAKDPDELGLLTSAYTFGYRAALLASEAAILLIATRIGWNATYVLYGALMGIGVLACLIAAEPVKADKVMAEKETEAPLWTLRGFYDAVAGPFLVFFKAHGATAVLMLTAISLFQLPNFVMGPMANPLYHDIGLSKDLVGEVRGSFGLVAVFLGVAAGGFLSLRLGFMRALLVGGTAQILGTIAYAVLPYSHGPVVFAAVMAADNFGISVAGITLVAYMSSLTSLGYTATQYALLSSTYAWAGKILKGFSGIAVQSLAADYGLMNAYAIFFVGAGLIGIPAILLFLWLSTRRRPTPAPS